MTRERLYMIHGTGPDRVGLVGDITAAVAEAGGNIVDLRQDVLHGLFTLFMVVDLAETELRVDELRAMVRRLAEDTGLGLTVEKYAPVGRSPEKRTMLMILIGPDRPGIIASVSQTLGKYGINIERAQNVGREDVFLMELLVDISNCTIPLDNAQSTLEKTMAQMDIRTMFQTEDVYNKKKRVVLFDIQGSFFDTAVWGEITGQTGLSGDDTRVLCGDDAGAVLREAAARLEGFPSAVMYQIVDGVGATPGTIELLQTLKTMGYTVAVRSSAFSCCVERLKSHLGIDHAFGVALPIDDDSRTIIGELPAGTAADDIERIIAALADTEGVSREDITLVSGDPGRPTPGIRLTFDLGTLLDLYNKRVVNKDNLVGILGSFGVPCVRTGTE
ncbi:MAG: ACT domain-containing protein [Chitinivibrionales bacterium]|nr:ACT domain-containing protein [Chitinivibrionales bacterium]